MATQATPFSRTEQEVIALAASSRRECAFIDEGPGVRLWNRLLDLLAPEHEVKPLANGRLEALRRLACASFASAGRPTDEQRAAARAAGLTDDEIETLCELAATRR
jgi:hypothetical protein